MHTMNALLCSHCSDKQKKGSQGSQCLKQRVILHQETVRNAAQLAFSTHIIQDLVSTTHISP